MNTFQELNQVGNGSITYNSEANTAIVWGTFLGNVTTQVIPPETGYELEKSLTLTSATNLVRDIVITIDVPYMANLVQPMSSVVYNGDDTRIRISRTSSTRWKITGIRDLTRYNDFFSNTDLTFNSTVVNSDDETGFSYTTVIDDQIGNTYTYLTTIEIQADAEYTLGNVTSRTSPPVEYLTEKNNLLYGNTDTTISISPFTNRNSLNAYRPIPSNLQAAWTTLTTEGTLTQSNVSANSHFVFGNGNVLIDTLETTTILDPAGGTDSEFTIIIKRPITLSDVLTITDLSDMEYQSTFTTANSSQGQFIYYGNSTIANSVTLSGNISTINNELDDIGYLFDRDYDGIGNILYTQIRTTDSVTQASNVSISVYPNTSTDGTSPIWSPNRYDRQTITYKRVATPDTGLYPMRWASNLGPDIPAAVDFDWYRANTVASGSGISVPMPYDTSFYVEDSAVVDVNDEIGLWLTATTGVTWYYRGQSFANRIYLGYGYNFGTGYGPDLNGTYLEHLQGALNHRNLSFRKTASGEVSVTIKLMRKRSGIPEETLVSSSLVLNDDYT